MFDRSKLFAHLESTEEGKAMIEGLKGDFAQQTKLSEEKGTLAEKVKSLEGAAESNKSILEYITAEKLDVEAIKGFVTKSREGETELDTLRRDLLASNNRIDELVTSIEEKDKTTQQLEADKLNNNLKSEFQKALPNIYKSSLDDHLNLGIHNKSIRYNSDNVAGGEIDGVFYPVAEYAEKYKTKYPHTIDKNRGVDSDPSKSNDGDQGGKQNYADMSSADILAEKYK